MLLRRDYSGKMMETLHLWLYACEQRGTVIAAIRMQPIITLGANDPYNRIRATVSCRDYRYASSLEGTAPSG